MTPYDELPVEVRRANWGWFGQPWWSYTCFGEDGELREDMRKPFPAGESCLLCSEAFAEGDSGQAVPAAGADGVTEIRHVHKECIFMNTVGGLAHHEGHCRVHGDGAVTATGLTLRQEAVEVWRRHREGTL